MINHSNFLDCLQNADQTTHLSGHTSVVVMVGGVNGKIVIVLSRRLSRSHRLRINPRGGFIETGGIFVQDLVSILLHRDISIMPRLQVDVTIPRA